MSFISYSHFILIISGQTFEVTIVHGKFWEHGRCAGVFGYEFFWNMHQELVEWFTIRCNWISQYHFHNYWERYFYNPPNNLVLLCSADLSASQPTVFFSHQIVSATSYQPASSTFLWQQIRAISHSQPNRAISNVSDEQLFLYMSRVGWNIMINQ